MPELPEVETTTRGLRKTIQGLTIQDVWTDLATRDSRKHETIADKNFFKTFKKQILNKKVLSVERRAKNILINIGSGPSAPPRTRHTILVHMKMTGHLLYGKYQYIENLNKWIPKEKGGPLNDPYNKFLHVVFTFTNGKQLAFSDARKFGKIVLLATETAHDTKHLSAIGPEPLLKNFTLEVLKERLAKKSNGKIKTTLMDQSVIAGIGNIYSDEILWRAGVHPERKVKDVQESEMKLIFKATKETLSKGIDFGGDSTSDYRDIYGERGKFQLHHMAYQRTGEKCQKKGCPGIIQRKMVNGRSAHFCSVHQKL